MGSGEDTAQSTAAVAIVFSAMAIEAITNSMGELLFSDWMEKKNERRATSFKLRRVVEAMDMISPEQHHRLWWEVRRAFALRNLAAHAKPQRLREESRSLNPDPNGLLPMPLSRLEQRLTASEATRACNAAQEVVELLFNALPYNLRMTLAVDGWSSDFSAPAGTTGTGRKNWQPVM